MNKIELILKPSKTLLAIFLILHGLVIVSVSILYLSGWLKCVLFILCLLSIYHLCWRVVLQHAFYIIRSCIVNDLEWMIKEVSGNFYKAELTNNIFISSWIIILNFEIKTTHQRCSLLLARDSLTPKVFRQLKIYLLSL